MHLSFGLKKFGGLKGKYFLIEFQSKISYSDFAT